MNPLELSVKKRVFSRVVFYQLVLVIFWVMGLLTPSETQRQAMIDERLGVPKPIIAGEPPPGWEKLSK